jgi:hypothetical protein
MSGRGGRDDLYVGYRPRMAPGLAHFLAPVVAVLLAGSVLLAWAIPALHRPYDPARSDFGDLRRLEGVLLAQPVPELVVMRPGETGERSFSRYLLVGRGKSGPKIDAEALSGRRVAVTGSLIYRDDQALVAVRSVEALEEAAAAPAGTLDQGEFLGTFTLRGEIVDSKCHLGTMRPGNTKTHRGCAVRCIAGGVPPVLLVRDEDGNAFYFLLVGPDGGAVNGRVLDLVAEPVEIRGQVFRLDDLLVLSADPSSYRRL